MIIRTIDLESNPYYPELVAFLNATTLEEASLHVRSLKPNYTNVIITTLKTSSGKVSKDNWRKVSSFTITCALDKSLQLDALIGHHTPDAIQHLASDNEYEAFRLAVEFGHTAIVEKLITSTPPTEIPNMIKAWNYTAFRDAAGRGHSIILDKLLGSSTPAEIANMIKAYRYGAFRFAVMSNNPLTIEKLIALTPTTEIANMIKADDYAAFDQAVKNGNLAIVEKLMALSTPAEIANMIKAQQYTAFYQAAGDGNLAIVKKLIASASPTEVTNMIKAQNYGAFHIAVGNSQFDIVNTLLTYSTVLSFAEEHDAEYGARFISPFIADQLASLHRSHQQLAATDIRLVFDLTDADEAKRCFYFIRHLIRRNDPNLLDEIRFLLSIPAVRALAAREITPGRPNELLRLALRSNNPAAAEILLQISTVRELAQYNQFYVDEARGRFDLAQVARDHESSMRALTRSEAQRLENMLLHYQPKIKELSVENIFTMLYKTLRDRYAASPAHIIKDDGTKLELPIEWDDFKKLKLTDKEYNDALRAYYINPNHTTLRYLSKPNRWMHENAAYVEVDPANPQDRWSTFHEYRSLIALFYLAASDEEISDFDGHTLEGRITHFINELALIGRAHNWHKTNAAGDECDDMTGDRPSCFSGVKGRLFQSVIGNPWLALLTLDLIKQELQTFVHGYFVSCINDNNRKKLQSALEMYKRSGESEDAQSLKELDIPPKKQDEFITMLTQKYPDQFMGDLLFKKYIMEKFERTRSDGGPPRIHACTFYGIVSLDSLLAEKPSFASSTHGTFAAGDSSIAAGVSSEVTPKTHRARDQ